MTTQSQLPTHSPAHSAVPTQTTPEVIISQSVAVLVDGNNIEISIHEQCGDAGAMLNFDTLIPKLIGNRALNRLIYFREGTKMYWSLVLRPAMAWHRLLQHALP